MRQSAIEHRAGMPAAVARFGAAHGGLFAALGIGLALAGVLFFPEARAAVEVWNESTAYGHCYLVLPMSVYLLWERREVIVAVPPRPQPLFGLLALPVAVTWFAAERLGIMEGRQLAAVAGVEVLFLSVLGWRLFRAVSGPLLFLFFLVPFGAFLTPALQRFTAHFTIVGLNLLGIPNYTDNFTIETPVGTFIVAEACAGLRFLIATVAFGVFYALVSYRSLGRRLAFVALSIVVPIVANGFRALGIVVLGQVLGSAEAAAADHIIYGWVFFTLVILLMIIAGLPLRESAMLPPLPAAHVPQRSAPSPIWVVAVVLTLLAVGPAASAALTREAAPASLAASPDLALPEGCSTPASGPDRVSSSTIRLRVLCGEQEFDVAVTAFPARASFAALQTVRRAATGEIAAEDVSVSPLAKTGEGSKWTTVQTTDPNRTTAYAAWINGRPVETGLAGRIDQARNSVLGGAYLPVLITVTAAEPAHGSPEQRRKVMASLRSFIAAQDGLDRQIEALSRRS